MNSRFNIQSLTTQHISNDTYRVTTIMMKQSFSNSLFEKLKKICEYFAKITKLDTKLDTNLILFKVHLSECSRAYWLNKYFRLVRFIAQALSCCWWPKLYFLINYFSLTIQITRCPTALSYQRLYTRSIWNMSYQLWRFEYLANQ